MDIRILDSHLREFLKTEATPVDIGRELSLRSASVEKIDPLDSDTAYELEITTNRVDMMSVMGIARETAAALTGSGITATYHEPTLKPIESTTHTKNLKIVNDPKLIRRICAVEMTVTQQETPDYIKKRLEEAGIRPLNVLIDITNYVMLETGHPTHAFDMDRLNTKTLTIRESKKGEKVTTLDNKTHTLLGGDIIITDDNDRIVDLVGIMGLENSSITDSTTRILFFVDNNDPMHLRRTSMGLAIRTDAAQLNEKDIDPELAMTAMQTGVALYEKCADAKVLETPIDIYPHPVKTKPVTVTFTQINDLIGIEVDEKKAVACLKLLGFDVKSLKDSLVVTPPSSRAEDITMTADVIEEIARMIGYHTLSNVLPPFTQATSYHEDKNIFYWERRVRNALKYWGLTEVYSYSMVSKELIDPTREYYQLSNPLDNEHVYMRQSLIPNLLEVIEINKGRNTMAIFELAKVYPYKKGDLPNEKEVLGILLKGENGTFSHIKGMIDQLVHDMGTTLTWHSAEQIENMLRIPIAVDKQIVGEIRVYTENLVVAELDFELLVSKYASLKKIYTEPSKYPEVREDITVIIDTNVPSQEISLVIQKQSTQIIKQVSWDSERFAGARTFHIVYQSNDRNLTTDDITPVREKIIKVLQKEFGAEVK